MSIRPDRVLGWLAAVAVGFGLAQTFAPAQGITIPNTFTNDTIADAPQVNANFASLAANALNRNGGTLGGTLNLNGQTLSGTATASGAWAFSSTVNVTGATTLGDLRGTAETITATGTVNDQALAATTTILRLNNASLLTLTGFSGGAAGRVLILESVGAGNVVLSYQTGSSPSNQLTNFATSSGTPLAAGSGTAVYVYDGTTSRWRLVQHEQGAWITPTFAAGNYTAATGNWTLTGGDVTTQAYRLSGRTLSVVFSLGSTTVSATPASLSIGNGAWGSFTSAKEVYGSLLLNDNSGGNAQGYALVGGSASVIALSKYTGTWSTATDTTFAFAMLTFEVN